MLIEGCEEEGGKRSCRHLRVVVAWRALLAGKWLAMWHCRLCRQVCGSGFGAVVGETALVVLGGVVLNNGYVA